jgi:ribonuclease HIII
MAGFGAVPHIGTDEVGKGDYFGPLVVAAAYADAVALERLPQVGVKDSKRLTEGSLRQKEALVRQICPAYQVVLISPARYNELMEKIGNLNRLLAWAHARALESLLESPECRDCRLAVADKFGDESYLQHALMARGRQVQLIQEVRAESDPAVAAASLLARVAFLDNMEALSQRVGVTLPRGATHVIPTARTLYRQGGQELLGQVAKLHFKTTKQVVNSA